MFCFDSVRLGERQEVERAHTFIHAVVPDEEGELESCRLGAALWRFLSAVSVLDICVQEREI